METVPAAVPVDDGTGCDRGRRERRRTRKSGSRAKLNFGDCMAYAAAMELGEPLLFKGDDFVHTDVTPAV